jgi:hypothetical protein
MLAKYNLKAVVFDDVEAEAKPIIDALNAERIPNIYINFDLDEEEEKNIKNIRLVFADLILGTSVSGDIVSLVEPIKISIINNISEDNGPFILIVWSKHSEQAEVLASRIREATSLNFEMIQLDKNNYLIQEGDNYHFIDDDSFDNLKNDITGKINSLEHIKIFLEWERDARNSISKILNSFIENISDGEKVKKTISSTIKKTLGNTVGTDSTDKLDAFYRTLNTVLADAIENNSNPIDEHEIFLNDLDLENIDDETKAEINRKTLFENITDNELKTGNIYSFYDFKSLFYGDIIKDVCGCDYENILESDLFRYTKKCRFFNKEAGETDADHQKRHYEKMKDNSYPVLLEFTPSCDIANNKYKKSRLIFGYMINSKYACLENESESLYITKFHFKYKNEPKRLDGNYRLAFFIKNIFAVNPEKVKELTPMIRARKEFATDLQHAIANHVSRIGISSLDL